MASSPCQYSFFHVLQEILFTCEAFLLYYDNFLLLFVRDASEGSCQHFEVIEVSLLRLIWFLYFRRLASEWSVDRCPSKAYFSFALSPLVHLTCRVVVRIIFIFFIFEDVQSKRLVLDDSIPTNSLLFVELIDDLILSLDLYLSLLQQHHQLLDSILSVYFW